MSGKQEALHKEDQKACCLEKLPLTEGKLVQSANLCFHCSKLQWQTLHIPYLSTEIAREMLELALPLPLDLGLDLHFDFDFEFDCCPPFAGPSILSVPVWNFESTLSMGRRSLGSEVRPCCTCTCHCGVSKYVDDYGDTIFQTNGTSMRRTTPQMGGNA